MEDREFISNLIGLLDVLTNRKNGGIIPAEQSEDEQQLEETTIKLLNKLLNNQ
jgi:hypothetical protein